VNLERKPPPRPWRAACLLIAWLAGMLFPMALLGKFWPAFRYRFDAIFGPERMHIIMHALLFAGLVLLLWAVLGLRPGRRALWLTLGVVLLVAALQEGFQAISNSYFSLRASLFDLGVDLAGALLGLAAVGGWTVFKTRRKPRENPRDAAAEG